MTKKLLLISIAMFTALQINAQSVGIGISTPNASAQLDISSTSKGLLIPRMTTAEKNGISSPAQGLLTYDSTTKSFWYFNNTWTEIGKLRIPYADTANINGSSSSMFKLVNTGSGRAISTFSESGTSFYGESNSGTGIWGYSYSGYGGLFSSSAGYGLGVIGRIYANGTSGSTGDALVINSSGNPVWQPFIGFAVSDVGAAAQTIANTTNVQLSFSTESYDPGSDYDLANNTFTAPYTGIYHFDALVLWNPPSTTAAYFAISLYINGGIYTTVRTPAISGHDASNSMSLDVKLTAGQNVSLYAYQATGVTQSINPASQVCRFTGHLVARQ